jgi:hypothetical protein
MGQPDRPAAAGQFWCDPRGAFLRDSASAFLQPPPTQHQLKGLVRPRNAAFNARKCFERYPTLEFRPTFRCTMRKNWIMTPFETAIFIAATALMAGGFIMVGVG